MAKGWDAAVAPATSAEAIAEENRRLKAALTRSESLLARAMDVIDALETHMDREARLRAEVNAELLRQLGALALKDGLTGLYNRRYFEDALEHHLLLCRRLGIPLSLLYVDVDHFKRFNDRAGHTAGDALLRRLGRLLDGDGRDPAAGRRTDVAARIGGEEFVVLLAGTDRGGARIRAERLRRRVARGLEATLPDGDLGPVTVTIGIATYPDDAQDGPALVRRADAALLAGKRAGRDRVHCAGERRRGEAVAGDRRSD